jgi:hypothetical protein
MGIAGGGEAEMGKHKTENRKKNATGTDGWSGD